MAGCPDTVTPISVGQPWKLCIRAAKKQETSNAGASLLPQPWIWVWLEAAMLSV